MLNFLTYFYFWQRELHRRGNSFSDAKRKALFSTATLIMLNFFSIFFFLNHFVKHKFISALRGNDKLINRMLSFVIGLPILLLIYF
ncbi:hypothetical protein AHMF7605_14340 [Adhaeribacter arboris]|uniref:Uncharacterized protein n=1 Tax=Adhaeribacter arboris TaxID=2072846 RepID=A0A2T2YGG1_9BACT|nr:hypothetical protein AHMF7605_14340 [Adhaeribacter arboris]